MDKSIDTEFEIELAKDSFSIGTNATGGCIKIYFDLDKLDEAKNKIDKAVNLYLAIKGNLDLVKYFEKAKKKEE